MSNDIKNTDKQDFSPIVRAIGSDLEQTQVRIASSANADMLFHYWKVGTYILYLQEREGWEARSSTNSRKLSVRNIPKRKAILVATSSICANLQVLIP